ncbi:hypothetical protein ACGFZL_11665 [Streptomyces sp. NPDC048182]|uniref:hypothetical protein n=1 Tax=Streptomyces sp. NPDC048182 TaxID=3365507 RepID=UPI0037159366
MLGIKLKRGVAGWALAMTVLGVGCSSHAAADKQTAPTHSTTAALRPDSLTAKIRSEIKNNVGFSVRDATDLGRTVDLQHLEFWRFCLSRKGKAPDSVDLGAVTYEEKCPTRWNAHVAALKTPRVTKQSFEGAYYTLLKKGYNSRFIEVFGSDGKVAEQDLSGVHGQVCEQEPRAGSPFEPSGSVKLHVTAAACR